jgi:putative nucleotidyltransferase with HDIG domain
MKFDPIVHRVAARFMPKAADELDLRKLEITSANLEEVIKQLVASVDDLDAVEAKLGVSLRNMTELMKQGVHNDDLYHNGETVLTHIGWVLDDANKLSANMDEEKRTLMKLTALFHDMGKTYTYKFDPERQKHTFHGHPELSVEIAKVLLAKHKESLGKLYQHVLDFTRLHDVFYALAHERSQSGEGNTKYVRRFMQEAIVQDGLAKDLLEFARADSFRARSHAEKIKEAEGVIADLEKEKERAAEEAALKARIREREQAAIPQIRERLEAEAPEAAEKLPDLKAAMEVLNRMKRYDILQWIMKLTRK